ncbi:MAG: carboxymuconolactone decarboxylase family protein [Agarilytica sp.]
MPRSSDTHFILHDFESAPDQSKTLLTEIMKKLGFVPNIARALAESPATLEAYVRLNEIFLSKATFTLMEKQLVFLVISKENLCDYCVAAHSFNASHVGLSEDQITTLRNGGTLSNQKLNSLAQLTSEIVTKRGFPEKETVNEFFNAGYGKEQFLELILAVGTKVIANYSNHFMQPELDAVFENRVWQAEQG